MYQKKLYIRPEEVFEKKDNHEVIKMDMTETQYRRAKEEFEKKANDIDEDDVKKASKDGQKKIEDLGQKIPDVLAEMWEDIKTMVLLLKDYATGQYKDVPWKVISAIAGAVAYFVMPIDVIPDIIPILGYMDDAVVLKLAMSLAGPDLEKYRAWRASR